MFASRKKASEKKCFEGVEEKLRHIAFIMDGNGRWAKKRAMPRKYGHKHGADNFKRVAEFCKSIGIRHMTVYAFSTENWSRPQKEVDAIIKLLSEFVSKAEEKIGEGYRFIFLGDKSPFTDELRERMLQVEKASAEGKYTLNIALNYGSRAEITHAVNRLISEGYTNVTEEDISSHLYTSASPDPDLVVRTGGDVRISNFLLWQSAYAELYFTNTLWPDLDENELGSIISDFLSRKRRYGGLATYTEEEKE